jgi:osmotically-inducible protein OsmY
MPASVPLRLLTLGALLSVGCVRQDTEILARVGRKLADRAQSSTAGLRDKLPFRMTTASAESSLANRVQQRFATDKLLAATTIDIVARGDEIELTGTVDREEQKRRAVDLAETTQGAEKVVDSVQVRGNKDAEK